MTDMDTMNPELALLLDAAGVLQEADNNTSNDADEAFRYAVLKRFEEDLGLPVMVKYGAASQVRDEYGISQNRVWGAVPDGEYTLFYIEPRNTLTNTQENQLDKTMLAAGAWYIGDTGLQGDPEWTHKLYVWPNDHPVLQQMPRPP